MPRWLLKCDTWRQQEPQFLPKSRQRTRRAPVAYPCHSGILSLAPPSQPSRWAGWDRKSPPASGRRLQPHPPQLWALSRPPVTKDISELKKKKKKQEWKQLSLTNVFVLLVALSSHHDFAVRPFQEVHQSAPVSRWHNAAEVRAHLRVLGVKLLQGLLQRRQYGVPSGRRAEHVVRSHAALTSVEELGPNQTAGSGLDVHVPKYQARTLAAQLQGDWGQVKAGCLQDDARHLLGA